MLQLGSLRIENGLIMAPMAGFTNLAFRLLIRRLGAGLVMTEMVSSMGLSMGQKKTLEYLRSCKDEKPLGVQIFGADPQVMARAGMIAAETGADLIDINMGCPVKKVVKTGAGAALLTNPKRAAEIVSAVRRASSLPLTVKIRTGWSPREPRACEIAKIVEDCGADALTLHPRFASEGFSVPARWDWINKVKQKVKIPVIGNGDVFDASHALELKQRTGCNGVMIGRGALRNPWIFSQIMSLEQGQAIRQPAIEERKTLIMEHFRLLSQTLGDKKAAFAMRGALIFYTKGLPHSGRFREQVTYIKDSRTLAGAVDLYFSGLPEAPASES
ncbi:MAG: tRNA dihydrouridine synthase DusB [Deltaproteobacteria bacterium]|nr:tRNA dihydrouridine synthase DusB [Deltaproteobacteria bacterium]